MSDLASIYDNISDVESETMSIDTILSSLPGLTLQTPMTFWLYLHFNKNLSESDVALTHDIIRKLTANEQHIAKKNIAYLERETKKDVEIEGVKCEDNVKYESYNG